MRSIENVNVNHLRRGSFLRATGVLLVAPILAHAQSATKPYRIGLLQTEETQTLLQRSLRELGYVYGRDVIYESRYSEGRSERLDNFELDSVHLQVDVIVAVNPSEHSFAWRP